MKFCLLFVAAILAPLPALANCIPPWKTQFACSVSGGVARAEFCRIADTTKHPGKKEAYYTYAVGDDEAELYFETDKTYFSTKDTNMDHPTDMTMAIGYGRGQYVYAFVTTEDRRDPGRIRNAEVRVYSSVDTFSNDKKDTEAVKLICDASSIIADIDSIRP